jgi:hypothetical protein
MVRSRLARAGFATTDIVATDSDLARFNQARVRLLTKCGVPQLAGLPDDPRWIREVLADRRALHPAKWGVLLAASGDCSFESLSQDLQEATARVGLQTLDGPSKSRRTRAPDRLYEALTFHQLLADACDACGMSVDEGRRWLRRDPVLGPVWRKAKEARRKTESRLAVLAYLEANPNALRSEVYLRTGGHVRWLLVHDRVWIDGVLPAAIPHLAKQRVLDL